MEDLGFSSIGDHVQISERASIYGAERISLGSHVRIDDFTVLAAGRDGIEIGNYVHIGVSSSLIGAAKITLCDFSGLSSRVSIYSSSDDYSGKFMTNPTVPAEYKNVTHDAVYVGRHVIIGSGAVVLPGVRIEEASAIGALSLVACDCASFGIYAGNPLRRVNERRSDLLELEADFLRKLLQKP